MLTSFEIKNFRTFSHLRIERLGRVNLIVGKNNVGKTTLLEALQLYGSIRPPSTVGSMLDERNEILPTPEGKTLLLLQSLFHGRHPRKGDAVRIGPLNGEKALAFIATAKIEPEQASQSGQAALSMQSAGIHYTLYPTRNWTCSTWSDAWELPKPPFDPPFLRSVGAQYDVAARIATWWDALSLNKAESGVVRALEVIAPRPIQDIRLIGDPRSDGGRIAIVDIEGHDERLAMATLGGGVVRMFQIAVALEYAAVYAKAASRADSAFAHILPLLLIDEVETGIHHALHADLWRFVFHAARQLNVQVFAATHSWDCLKGFAQAVFEDEQNDGLAIRLERDPDEEATRAVVIDREKLPIVARDTIEVR